MQWEQILSGALLLKAQRILYVKFYLFLYNPCNRSQDRVLIISSCSTRMICSYFMVSEDFKALTQSKNKGNHCVFFWRHPLPSALAGLCLTFCSFYYLNSYSAFRAQPCMPGIITKCSHQSHTILQLCKGKCGAHAVSQTLFFLTVWAGVFTLRNTQTCHAVWMNWLACASTTKDSRSQLYNNIYTVRRMERMVFF